MAPYGDSRRPLQRAQDAAPRLHRLLIAFRNRTTYDEFDGDDLHSRRAPTLIGWPLSTC